MTKQLLRIMALALLVVTFFINPTYATTEKGDTLVIHAQDQQSTPWNEIVMGDTNASGVRNHMVYELDPGGWYPMSSTLTSGENDLHIIGGKRTAGQSRPYILVDDEFGNNGYWYMFSAGMDVTFEGLHVMQIAATIGGNIGAWARAGLELTGTNAHVVFHDCIWDFTTGFTAAMTKDGTNLKVTNCLFRFNKPLDNAVWAGQGLDVSAATLDTVIIKNCTWYGGGPFMLKTWESTEEFFQMDHVSIVDFVQWPIHGVHWVNSEFTNNLFYNAYTMGEDSAQIKGQDPDLLPFGVIDIDTLYFDENQNMDATREAARNVLVSNNNNFTSQVIKDYWAVATAEADQEKYHFFKATDPTFYDGFMNTRTRAMFEDDATWPGLVMQNTTSLDPEFTDYFDYADTLVQYSKAFYIYAWPGTDSTSFMMDPDGEPLNPTDPMYYDMKITNSTLRTASTSGGPIGDLTWELADGYNSTQAEILTDVKETPELPSAFVLKQNYPNPFNPTTNIEFSIPESGIVTLKVYNILGQEVATLVNKQMATGSYQVDFDASKLSSGVYIYRLKTNSFTSAKKMMLLK